MERKSKLRLIAVLLMLAVCSLPAFGQDDPGGPLPEAPQGPPQGGFGGPGQGQFGPGRFGPGGPGPGGFGQGGPMMPMGPMMMPEMAKKMAAIMTLRQMLGLRLTANDISAALPILKGIRDSEKALEARSGQLLDEEKKALLTASPDNPPKGDVSEKMGRANEEFRDRQEKAWDSLFAAIGREKTMGLRSLLGQGGPGPQFGPGGPGGFGGGSQGFPGGQPPPGQLGGGFGGRPGGQGGLGGGGGIGIGRGQGGRPGQPGGGRFPGQQPGQPGGPGGPPGPGGLPQGGPGGGPGQFPGGQPSQPGQGPGFGPGGPGSGPGGGQGLGPGMMPPGMGFGGPRTGLADLINLLEQKLAAMKGR